MKKPKISPRKAPKQQRSRGLVDAIVQAATRVLVREGYEGSSTNHVAEAAGVSIGSLYQYFPNKDALVAAVIDKAIERHTRRIETEIERVKDRPLEDALRLIVEAAFDLYTGNGSLFRVMFVQAPKLDRLQNILRSRRHIAQLLRGVLESKGIVPRNPDLSLFVLINGTIGVLQTAVFEMPPGANREEIVDELVRLLRGYLRDLQ